VGTVITGWGSESDGIDARLHKHSDYPLSPISVCSLMLDLPSQSLGLIDSLKGLYVIKGFTRKTQMMGMGEYYSPLPQRPLVRSAECRLLEAHFSFIGFGLASSRLSYGSLGPILTF
jgi:hypothetical protein